MTTSEHLFALLDKGDFSQFRKAADQSPLVRVACDRNGYLLLHRAAKKGSLAACRYLLKCGIPATCPGPNGATPLHYAAARGDMTIMKILMQAAGGQHSPVNAMGLTPLHVAAGEGNVLVVRMLLDAGADCTVQDKFGRLPLHFAAGADQLEVVKLLTGQNSMLLDQADAFGQRPVHWAAMFECVRMVNWLILCRADLQGPDIYGRAPLFFLRRLDKGAPLSLPTAIQLAIAYRGKSVSRLTPLQHAIRHGSAKAVKKMLQGPTTLTQRDELGHTPLHMAAFARNRILFQWIRKQGADAWIADDYGWTPLKLLSYRMIGRLKGA